MYKKLFLYSMLAVCGFLTSCGKEKVIFEKDYTIKNDAWTYADTLSFAFDITDTMALYDIVLTVEHTPQYSMQNIYTNIYTKFPKGERIKQTLSIDLADNTGTWQGKCSGSSCDFNIKIQENAFFNILGAHVITLEQFMRVESLAGIKNIGLKIVDMGKRRDLNAEKNQGNQDIKKKK
jgi:gliding motility-associated lipoprotein GldH